MNKGSEAHQIVCKLVDKSGIKPTNFPRHMVQAKRLLEVYELEDILFALDLYGTKMYSLGYLNEERMLTAKSKRAMTTYVKQAETLNRGEDIAERNQRKLQRLYNQPRVGEGNTFDLLGIQSEDS